MPSAKFQIRRACEICGQVFFAKTMLSVYCSRKCSQVAFAAKKKKLKNSPQVLYAKKIGNERLFLTVSEASKLYEVSADTIYRMIKKGKIKATTGGVIRIPSKELAKLFGRTVDDIAKGNEQVVTPRKFYSIEKDNSYTIGEIQKKYNVSEKTVYMHIRQYSIPIRQIGQFVYAPKAEVDQMYKGIQTKEQ